MSFSRIEPTLRLDGAHAEFTRLMGGLISTPSTKARRTIAIQYNGFIKLSHPSTNNQNFYVFEPGPDTSRGSGPPAVFPDRDRVAALGLCWRSASGDARADRLVDGRPSRKSRDLLWAKSRLFRITHRLLLIQDRGPRRLSAAGPGIARGESLHCHKNCQVVVIG